MNYLLERQHPRSHVPVRLATGVRRCLCNTVAMVFYFAGSVNEYHALSSNQARFDVLLAAVRPERCPHCGREHTCVFWGSYARWVYGTSDRLQVRIERMRCIACGVTDALLPSFLHIFRRYVLPLIQQALSLALEAGLWGDTLADAVGPYHQPAAATLCEWMSAFIQAVDGLLAWLLLSLSALDPLAELDPGRPPAHLSTIADPTRRTTSLRAWQTLRLTEALYAATRARQPDLAFQADALLAFLSVARQSAGHSPRLLACHQAARAPTCP
jgi:hypothetical protein